MNVEVLKEKIVSGRSYVFSDGTLNPQHLLPKAYDLMQRHELLTPKMKEEILKVFDFSDMDAQEVETRIEKNGLYSLQYYGYARLREDKGSQELASSLWNEDIFELFEEISPEGYYFGSLEGDGACIGWFVYEE